MSASHDALRSLASGYALGMLEPDERRAFEAHLERCAECVEEVRSVHGAMDALARSVPQRTPPAYLRERVMSAVLSATDADGARQPSPPSGVAPPPAAAADERPVRRAWLPVAASILIALGAGIYGSHMHVETRLAALSERAEAVDREVAAARRAAVDARAAMLIFAAPDVVQIDLRGGQRAAGATARALWSRRYGMLFAAPTLPAPPAGQAYEVWVVTAQATIHAGTVSDVDGGFTVFATPPDMPAPIQIAVTLQPPRVPLAPAGEPVLTGDPQTTPR